MKKPKHLFKITCLTFLIFTVAYAGCKKAETLQPEKSEKIDSKASNEISALESLDVSEGQIETLKSYMSSLINVDVSEISYDATIQQFIVNGIAQISLEDLNNSYNDTLIIE